VLLRPLRRDEPPGRSCLRAETPFQIENFKDKAVTLDVSENVRQIRNEVFRDNGRDGLSFLVAQPIKYVPIGDKIELNLGADPEVVFELVKLRLWRDNVWMLVDGTAVYRRVDAPGIQIEVQSSVAGWADHSVYAQRVRNYTAKPIEVEVRRTFPGHAVFRSALKAKNHDYQTIQYTATLKPGEKANLLYEILQHQGYNAKQNNVTLEEAVIEP
jgi:hypothetical protein